MQNSVGQRYSTAGRQASILGGGGGAVAPNENIGGQTYRFAPPPPPPNNFDNLKINYNYVMQE